MHDFFVDRLVHGGSVRELTKSVDKKAGEGGGGVHGVAQEEVCGGNAVNLAHALARLGLRVLLVTHSDAAHEGFLRGWFGGLDAELSVKPLPPGLTVAFEGQVNVMLGDVGGAGRFGPSLLDERDWGDLQNASLVCAVNWAANREGTGMIRALRERLGPKKPIFFDPADFRDRRREFGAFLREASTERPASWVSMNEEEAKAAAALAGLKADSLPEVCRSLAAKLGVRFDLHGIKESYTSDGTEVFAAACREVRPRRLTGAGDAWDAAAIYGRLKRMDEEERLRFANKAAAMFIGRKELSHPTAREVSART